MLWSARGLGRRPSPFRAEPIQRSLFLAPARASQLDVKGTCNISAAWRGHVLRRVHLVHRDACRVRRGRRCHHLGPALEIKPIRTPADHAAARAEIERLWGKAKANTKEGDELEVLSTLVDTYEREHIRIPAPRPHRGDPLPDGAGRALREGLASNLQDQSAIVRDHDEETPAEPRDDSSTARATGEGLPRDPVSSPPETACGEHARVLRFAKSVRFSRAICQCARFCAARAGRRTAVKRAVGPAGG